MTQMTARYPGTCAATGAKFRAGDLIDYDRATKKATLVKAADPVLRGKRKRDMTDIAISRQSATQGRYVSDVFRTSGGTFFRNKAGRCEDAPCCGCCTI